MSTHRTPAGQDGTLKFFYGPMECGKSTLALQMDYNRSRRGLQGLLLTRHDRSSKPQITSRIGVSRPAIEIGDDTDLAALIVDAWAASKRVDYLIVDEAQFLSAGQVDQLALIVDEMGIDVYTFGIATDFRGRVFSGTQRLFEVADEAEKLQVEVLCWCGRPGRFNARVVDGVVAREGEQVVVADTTSDGGDSVHYQVLCRQHHRLGDLGDPSGIGAVPLSDSI